MMVRLELIIGHLFQDVNLFWGARVHAYLPHRSCSGGQKYDYYQGNVQLRSHYLYAAGEPPALDEPYGVVRFVNRIPVPIPGRFEALGIPLLRRARAHAGLILMDECGFLESDAVAFQVER